MKAWFKGGLILGGIYFIISVVSLIMHLSGIGASAHGTTGYWIIIFSGIILLRSYESIYGFVNGLVYSPNELLPLVIFIILNSIIYFIIGAVIGLIVGKVKNKNS